jgi:histidine decarboxylase
VRSAEGKGLAAEPAAVAPVHNDHDGPVPASLEALRQRLERARSFNIGFPGATDFDYTALTEFFGTHLLNNVGDPWIDGVAANHTKPMEREVVTFAADLLRAPADDRWGYVTAGGSEGNLYALQLARDLLPRAIAFYSDAAHYSIPKALHLLNVDAVRIRADQWGEIDYDDFASQLDRLRHRPTIVVATVGTTMTEAVDDVRRISGILDHLAIRDRFIHADGALSGIPLALLDPNQRPGFDFADGADSMSVSGHKFIGSPVPSGIVVVRASHRDRVARTVGYTATPDATISGSRSGHAPLVLWYAIRKHGVEGLGRRAQQARQLAAYAKSRLDDLGWVSYRHDHAFTVVLKTPPEPVLRKWVLATHNGWSHLITMPGVTVETINAFLSDMVGSLASARENGGPARPTVPIQPSSTGISRLRLAEPFDIPLHH